MIEDPVLFTAVNEGVFPEPEAAKPIVVFELVQVNVPPAGVVENAEAGTLVPLHTVILATGLIVLLPPPGGAGTIQSSIAIRDPAEAPLCVKVIEFVPPGIVSVAILPELDATLHINPVPPLIVEKPDEQ